MKPPLVGIVHLGRERGMGGLRRIEGLRDVFERVGAETFEVALLRDHRLRPTALRLTDVGLVARGALVPEAMAWSMTSVQRELDARAADLLVCITSRAFHPAMVDAAPVVIDFVDVLSVSYRDRARIVGRDPRYPLFRALAITARRFEQRPSPAGVARIAAGWSDARDLDATWVPITYPEVDAVTAGAAAHDLLFFGNLSYPPNVEAVDRIAALWPSLIARRPGTTLLLAGARPVRSVQDHAAAHGWSLLADFDRLADVLADARLAIVPLVHASGIQTKVLEAAAYGVAQIVAPAALAGMEPGFPAAIASDDRALVDEVVRLLGDPEARAALGRQAQRHLRDRYSPDAWTGWAKTQLDTKP